MHQSGGALVPAWDALWDAGLFGPHANVVHGASITHEWLARLVSAGVTFTCTPENELAQGHGMPITGRLLRLDSAPSLGTDTEAVVAGDVQTAARVALAVQRAFDHEEARGTDGLPSPTPTITVQQALAWATIQGARALGLADRLGRLEVGRSADLVVLDTRSLNLSPKHAPIALAIQAHPGNVEAVMIAGQWRKREHRLVGVDLDAIRDQLAASGERLLSHLQK
jgi:cytosine/adenosine deaminase-related metal-dependent hydrolase